MSSMTRREMLEVVAGSAVTVAGCKPTNLEKPAMSATASPPNLVSNVAALSFPWQTLDPFLFCVYHDDKYPHANANMGPDASLAGRNLGMDFEGIDGWRMYHGRRIPGFPQHPHRGFETVTVVRKGLVDHSDSLGAAARYGQGDVQWMTAGAGILHAEMFPLLETKRSNPLELFQIWLNLPKKSKMVKPHFTMMWGDHIPAKTYDTDGAKTIVTTMAGGFDGTKPQSPPPDSWASHAEANVAIWTIKMDPKAKFTLPATSTGTNRRLYYFAGDRLQVAGETIPPNHSVDVAADHDVPLENHGTEPLELLMLQGKPIGEPVVQHGPFVMNTRQEIQQAISDFQRTQFGGWPWDSSDPVHAREESRFARHADGKLERPA